VSDGVFGFDDPAGRVIVARVAPYNEVAIVNDGDGPYEEIFLPDAFAKQVEQGRSTPLRIWLTREHGDNPIGHAVGLRSFDNCLYASLRVWEGVEGDDALAMVRDQEFRGVSMEALKLRDRTVEGVTQVAAAHLSVVSLAGENRAYWGARVVGIRGDRPDDQPGPASQAEQRSWDLDRMDRGLGELQMKRMDAALERLRSKYAEDPDYQAVLRERLLVVEERAALQAAIAPKAAVDKPLRPQVLQRDCGEVLAIR
jgi:phage head maturation protease